MIYVPFAQRPYEVWSSRLAKQPIHVNSDCLRLLPANLGLIRVVLAWRLFYPDVDEHGFERPLPESHFIGGGIFSRSWIAFGAMVRETRRKA